MAMTTERKRTIEARLDRLDDRACRIPSSSNGERQLTAVLKGTLDLLRDVLLEDEPAPAMTAERAEELTKRAT